MHKMEESFTIYLFMLYHRYLLPAEEKEKKGSPAT